MSATQRQDEVKQQFIKELGEEAWSDGWEAASRFSPDIVSASIKLSSVPRRKQFLSLKIQHLISIAVDAASTHLYVPGIRRHIKAALSAGATLAEVMEVIELTSTLGIHACNIGVPMLVEVMREEGLFDSHPTAGTPLDQRREDLKKDFTEKRGYWHEFWEDFLRLDPEFFEAYSEFSSVPWVKDAAGAGNGKGGVLEPKVYVIKELIYCAFDAASTHLYKPGLKLHMQNVLRYGGKPEEIMEVLEIATLLSLHTISVAAPILAQEAA